MAVHDSMHEAVLISKRPLWILLQLSLFRIVTLTLNLTLTYPNHIHYSNDGHYPNPKADSGPKPNLSMYGHQPMNGQAILNTFLGYPVCYLRVTLCHVGLSCV